MLSAYNDYANLVASQVNIVAETSSTDNYATNESPFWLPYEKYFFFGACTSVV